MNKRFLYSAGLILLFFSGLTTSCDTAKPCDSTCQSQFFQYFRELNICNDVCSLSQGNSIKFYMPLQSAQEKLQTVSMDRSRCGQCITAWETWKSGSDCKENATRCQTIIDSQYTYPLLQICLRINERMTWTFGRDCEQGDKYPCIKTENDYLCWGCKNQDDCNRIKNPFLKEHPLSCDTSKGRCSECKSNSDCPSYRTCSDGQCAGCEQDSHCAPEFTGKYCSEELRCLCFDSESCFNVGFLGCEESYGACKPCKSTEDCTKGFDKNSICLGGRCMSSCTSDTDCEHYTSAVCDNGRCRLKPPNCKSNDDCRRFGKDVTCHESRCVKPKKGHPCKDDAFCKRFGEGVTCQQGRCVRKGTSGATCKSNEDCKRLGPQGRCIQGKCERLDPSCTSDEKCQQISTNLRCNQGRCSFERPPPCRSDTDCTKDGKTGKCLQGKCIPAGGCKSNEDCLSISPKAICRLGRCVRPPECSTTQDCRNLNKPGVCQQGRCIATNQCRTNSECVTKLKTKDARCLNGSCVKGQIENCTTNEQCVQKLGANARCINGRCQVPKPCQTQSDCPRDLQCLRGFCRR